MTPLGTRAGAPLAHARVPLTVTAGAARLAADALCQAARAEAESGSGEALAGLYREAAEALHAAGWKARPEDWVLEGTALSSASRGAVRLTADARLTPSGAREVAVRLLASADDAEAQEARS